MNPPLPSDGIERLEEIEDVKIFISKVGAAETILQFKILALESKRIRELIEQLLPPK